MASRSLIRDRRNLRYTAWGRPVIWQRLVWRDGLESRGSCCSFSCACHFSSSVLDTLLMIAFSAARFSACLAISFSRFSSRLIMLFFAITQRLLFPEREVERTQQRGTFLIAIGCGRDGDIHTANFIDFVVIDFGEDDLLTNTHAVVATTVEGTRVQATEVPYTRNGDIHQTLQEFPHTVTTQGYLATNREAFTNLETGNGFTCLGDHRLLAADPLHFSNRIIQLLFVADRFTNTHVQGDFGNPRYLHHVGIPELLEQCGRNFCFINFFQSSHSTHSPVTN